MKKIIVLLWAMILAVSAIAQQAESVRSFIEESHDSLWYVRQMEAWNKVVEQEPADENAWRNLFEAAYGLTSTFSMQQGDTCVKTVLQRMKTAIPDTYAYYISAYRACPGPRNEFAEKAIKLLPDSLSDSGYDAVLGYLWMMGDADGEGQRTALFNEILNRQYVAGKYPSFILRFGYNQLQGMDKGGIFFGNGDMELFDKILLQRALHVHTDKVIVVMPFLMVANYRDALCKRLGIPPFQWPQIHSEADLDKAISDMVDYIIKQTGRSAYFSPSARQVISELMNKLYNDGLVFKYSESPYDNIASAMRHVEQDYHFDYLSEPAFQVEKWWTGSENLQLNYVVMLAHLVEAYRETGRQQQADRLYDILKASVENGGFSEAKKKEYLGYLDQWK